MKEQDISPPSEGLGQSALEWSGVRVSGQPHPSRTGKPRANAFISHSVIFLICQTRENNTTLREGPGLAALSPFLEPGWGVQGGT